MGDATSATKPLLSAALGEREQMSVVAERLPDDFAFAKVGPSQCKTPAEIRELWQDARKKLPQSVELVTVAYADFKHANTLPPEEVFALAIESGFRRCLLDTFSKVGASTIDVLGMARLKNLSSQAQDSGLWWALAGSLRYSDAEALFAERVYPDCLGVRGDVCRGDRKSMICEDRMVTWSKLFRTKNN